MTSCQSIEKSIESPNENPNTVLQTAKEKSLALLRCNMTPHGIMAASQSTQAEHRRYTRIFGRDAAICALGMIASGDAELADNAVSGLINLAEHQADNGQIPKYITPSSNEADFWYLGCIDATLWWLIAIKFTARWLPDAAIEQRLEQNINRAIVWLHCQEHPHLRLLQQNEASDWADIMPRSGFVLYSNALWFYVKQLYGTPYQQETRFHFNHLFCPFSRDLPDYHRLRLLMHYVRNKTKNGDLYLSFVNFSFWGDEGDVFGNILAVLFGLAGHSRAERILDTLGKTGVNHPYPIRSVCTPITKDHLLWRPYMQRHRQNLEFCYHNGGVWPFIGGFWVMALADAGLKQEARAELYKLAQMNRLHDWQFNEWFHGKTGEACGMPGQSWNAAMYLLASRCLEEKIFP
jgi:glycogen debranching enzyme